jgi:phage tail protein X
MEKLRSFAVCMRAHDIEMTDPLPDGTMKIKGRLANVTRATLNADPGFQAAMAACQDKLPQDDGKTEGAR